MNYTENTSWKQNKNQPLQLKMRQDLCLEERVLRGRNGFAVLITAVPLVNHTPQMGGWVFEDHPQSLDERKNCQK